MMHWTTTKPTVPGWYWWREGFAKNDSKHIVLVWKHSLEGLRVDFLDGCADDSPIDYAHGEWAGPIEEPKEPHHG